MLKLVRTAASAKSEHEDQFVRRYDWLRSWAIKLSHDDVDAAGDLLQNAFVQFCLSKVDLDSIDNVEAYLYTMLRNLRLSQLRLAARAERRTIPIGEYDTIDIGLRGTDPAYRLQACVELSMVCDWACQRKETSKAASVLILRFFHGYEPTEIAPIIGSSTRIVGAWLQVARRDLRTGLHANGDKVGRFEVCTTPQNSSFVDCATTIDELRARIFASRQGSCLNERELRHLYGEPSHTIGCSRLAHLVSCQDCLKRAAMRLNLPAGPDGPFNASGSTTSIDRTTSGNGGRPLSGRLLHHWRRSLRDVLEHSPSELRLGVDGFIVGVLKVHSEVSEISVEVNLEEPAGFVEVFSSQGLQMLHFEVSPPPNGGAHQTTHVEFAEGRSLTVTVDFTRPKPVVELRYYDPLFVADPAFLVESLPEPESSPVSEEVRKPWWQNLRDKWRRSFVLPAMPIRQAAVGSAIILVLAAVWWYTQLSPAPVFAAELLRDASREEQVDLHAANTATHRTYRIEETANGRAVGERRVEVWYSSATKVRAVRLYDEQNRLKAGEWTGGTGTRTVYQSGNKAVKEPADSTPPVTVQDIWRWEPTAQQFSALVSGLPSQHVREEAGSWVITYQGSSSSSSSNTPLLKATLVLDKTHLRATEQTLVLQEAGTTHEFRFTENIRERFASADIDQSHFVPEPELTNLPLRTITPAPIATKLLTGTDRDRFEMALTYQLHLLEACLSGHPSIVEVSDGRLFVNARANTAQCSRDITRNLAAYVGPTLAPMRIPPGGAPEHRLLRLDQVEHIGGYGLFKSYFASRVLDPNMERDAIRQKAGWATERSRSIVYHAEALAELTQRWKVDSLRKLDLDTVHKWQMMVQAHAIDLSREEQVLRRELQPILFPNVSSQPAAAIQPMNNLGDIPPVVDELVALAMLQDETIRSLCSDVGGPASERVLDPTALGSSFDRAIAVANVLTKKWPLDP